MLISFEDIKIGDEIIIPSNSNLKYLKVVKLVSNRSINCTYYKSSDADGGNITFNTNWEKPNTCSPDISKHNKSFSLKNEGGYRDIWLVRREVNV